MQTQDYAFGEAGQAFYDSITDLYELSIAEHALLVQACQTLDLLSRLQTEIDNGELTAKGSMGQTVSAPSVTEIRGHRATFQSLVKAIGLPASDAIADVKSQKASASARARWGMR